MAAYMTALAKTALIEALEGLHANPKCLWPQAKACGYKRGGVKSERIQGTT